MKLPTTMKRFPVGVMVIPLPLGCTVNILFPNALTTSGFTAGLFRNGIPTLIGLFLSCSGTTIDIKMVGATVWKGAALIALRFLIGFGLGLLLNTLFGEVGLPDLTPLAVIGAVTSFNDVICATLASEYGDETDAGATFILTLNDGPFFTVVTLGASGTSNFSVTDIIVSIIPVVIGFTTGNLDHDWRKVLAAGMTLLPPFSGFALEAGMNFRNIMSVGMPGIVLGLLTVLATGLLSFFIYSALRRKADPMSAAIGTTAGAVIATPTAVVMVGPSFQPQTEAVAVQTAVTVAITAMLCPLLVSWLAKFSKKWNVAHGIMETDMALDPLLGEAGTNIEEQREEV